MPVRRAAAGPSAPPAARELRILENRAGTERAVRLSVLYAVALGLLYTLLGLYARSAPGGTSPGATAGLLLFGLVAVAVGLVGVLLALTSAPRRLELGEDATTVVGRFGGRRRLPPLRQLDVRVVRHFRGGLLSSAPVEQVEVTPGPKGRRIAFLLEEHLLPPTTPTASSSAPAQPASESRRSA